jgi:hypothetical protein
MKSLDLALILWDLDNYFRGQLKYNENITEEAYEALDQAREKFYELMNQRNVSLDDILK